MGPNTSNAVLTTVSTILEEEHVCCLVYDVMANIFKYSLHIFFIRTRGFTRDTSIGPQQAGEQDFTEKQE